jgi:hypothetical protein
MKSELSCSSLNVSTIANMHQDVDARLNHFPQVVDSAANGKGDSRPDCTQQQCQSSPPSEVKREGSFISKLLAKAVAQLLVVTIGRPILPKLSFSKSTPLMTGGTKRMPQRTVSQQWVK